MKKIWIVLAATSALWVSGWAQAEADPKLWSVVKEAFFPKRDIQEVEFLKVDGPKRAESGAQVPVTFTYDKAAANGVVLKKLYVIVDANPIQLASTYHLTDMLGGFQMSTRIRQETDSFVRLIGETADGKLYMGKREIRAAGGCGGTVDNNESEVRAAAGKIKLSADVPKFGEASTTTFNIKHVMRTGLQRDLVSQGYVPAFYINKTVFTYNGKELMTVDVGVGTSEDPYMKFSFIPDAPGTLEVVATDNEGKTFSKSINVNN
ncbi:quinoprotein dehydrogenase-associated SoxYZ-like carrier [Methylophilus aquaticus]|uniref:Quinoprotein dehydrogenase-associated SoxYZ-like carrier n=1 Tax=Methylophilus aquaticus TaxID=1971610 RepID=A0ABT9JPN6_9PROT|nr:quinoprotein dehydrogenase-associated SoxYZ-like carrier [Methylophilus aquaticus]MDP8566528.1 quinoprotein dehydrogenase-associated SoxYZ-like carrier [Methylophilus aquaticus]